MDNSIQECEYKLTESTKCRHFCTRKIVLSNLMNETPVYYYFCKDHVGSAAAMLSELNDLISLRIDAIKGWEI